MLFMADEGSFELVIETASKGTSITSDKDKNMFIYGLPEVDADMSYFTTLEDEVTGHQHFLLEPDCNRNCLDDAANFGTFNVAKRFSVENFSCAFKFDEMKFDSDALDLFLMQDGAGMHGSTLDEKVGKFSIQPTSDETLFAAEKFLNLNYGACNGSHLGDIALESQSPCFQERDCDAEASACNGSRLGGTALESQFPCFQGRDCDATTSELSCESIMALESTCANNPLLLDQMTIQELHHFFSRTFGRRTSVMDKQWLKHRILFALQKKGTLGSQQMPVEKQIEREKFADCNFFKCLPSLVRDAGFCSIDKTTAEEALVPQMIMRKPPRRCYEGLLEQKSRYHFKKHGASCKNTSNDFLHIRSHDHRRQKRFGATQLVYQEACKRPGIQVSLGLRAQKGRQTKNTSFITYDLEKGKEKEVSVSNKNYYTEPSTELQHNISEDSCTSSNTQRASKQGQRHRRWTTPEVKKLIEGVSQYGVGKWTDIKRLLFSSSHRTSINLKDKWRNLLKASCNQVQRKREAKQVKRQASNELPEPVLYQVRDLAFMYPHPKGIKSNASLTAPDGCSPHPTTYPPSLSETAI